MTWTSTITLLLVLGVVVLLPTNFGVTASPKSTTKPRNGHSRRWPSPNSLRASTSTTPKPAEQLDSMFCTLENFQKCISELWPNVNVVSSSAESGKDSQASSSSNDLAFPTTHQQLLVTCSDLKERVRCLDRHSERCFTLEMLQVFGHIVTNAKQFVHDLCDNKNIQNGKSLPCQIVLITHFTFCRISGARSMLSQHFVGRAKVRSRISRCNQHSGQ